MILILIIASFSLPFLEASITRCYFNQLFTSCNNTTHEYWIYDFEDWGCVKLICCGKTAFPMQQTMTKSLCRSYEQKRFVRQARYKRQYPPRPYPTQRPPYPTQRPTRYPPQYPTRYPTQRPTYYPPQRPTTTTRSPWPKNVTFDEVEDTIPPHPIISGTFESKRGDVISSKQGLRFTIGQIGDIPERGRPDYDPNFPEKQRQNYERKAVTERDFCGLKPDSGYWCNGAQGPAPPQTLRFYYDKNDGDCKCLIYNGCDGNGNNFKSSEQCQLWCNGYATTKLFMYFHRFLIQHRNQSIYLNDLINCAYFF